MHYSYRKFYWLKSRSDIDVMIQPRAHVMHNRTQTMRSRRLSPGLLASGNPWTRQYSELLGNDRKPSADPQVREH